VTPIEQLRARVERSAQPVLIHDFGAGAGPEGREVERTLGEMCRTSSKPRRQAEALFRIVCDTRPSRCLELGTCVGISAAYIAAALRLNRAGRLLTIEGSEALAALAGEHLVELGLDDLVDIRVGRFVDILPSALAEEKVDFAFVDGHHEEEATVAYFDAIASAAPAGATIVFDDIAWSRGMARAWGTIQRDLRASGARTVSGFGVVRRA
jgi:predicted O-methyltransferase YrrM